jgi:hypothetical protein
MWVGSAASFAALRSMPALAAGASLTQIASRLALISSFVRPVLTLRG